MTKKIVLIGSGEIGSRHLQALAKLPMDIQIDIVEPKEKSKELGLMRFNEVSNNKNKQQLFWHNSVDEIENLSDLVIVATTATGRSDLVINLLEKGHSRFLIEKMVCQSREEYEKLLSKINEHNAKGWINAARRYFASYQKLKESFRNSEFIDVSVIAGKRGLGTSAIHYIDLFSWFANNSEITLNGDCLYDELFTNKRGKDLVEFAGTITGNLKNGSTLTITFLPKADLPIIVIITGNDNFFLVDELNENKILNIKNLKKDYLDYKYEHVSTTTAWIVEDILKNDECLLPDLNSLFKAHSELFRIFNSHIKKVTGSLPKLCPIT